jgi:hypothetical protein
VGAIGIRGNYLFKISGSESSAPVADKSEQLLGMLADLPSAPEEGSRIFLLLTDGLGIPFEGIAYERKDVFQFEFLTDVWFGRPHGAGEARYFLHRAADSEAAAARYAQLAEEQAYEYEAVDVGRDRGLYRHEYLDNFFAMARREDWLFGVEGAPDRRTAEQLLGRLSEALDG